MSFIDYDIDIDQLRGAAYAFGATQKQMRFAMTRANRRVEAWLLRQTRNGLKKHLALRAARILKRRVKKTRIGYSSKYKSFGIWFGLNELPISDFAGRVKGSRKKGARFRDKHYQQGFVGKSKYSKRNTIFARKGEAKYPIEEQTYPIDDAATVYLEDVVFEQALERWWREFERDLRARVLYGLGEK